MAAGRRRTLEKEFEGRVRFERRTYLLMPREGQRPTYDAYVISHRVRAAELTPELGFAIPELGAKYPRSSWPSQLFALQVQRSAPEKLPALEDALFGAMFRELRDISDEAVLRGCARACGLDEELVALAMTDDALKEQAIREHQEAEALQLGGIPALAIPGVEPITGAVPLDLLRRALAHALSR